MNLSLYERLTQLYLTNQREIYLFSYWGVRQNFEVIAWTTGLEEICIYVLWSLCKLWEHRPQVPDQISSTACAGKEKGLKRRGSPKRCFNLFVHSDLLETGKEREAIDTLRGYKIQS